MAKSSLRKMSLLILRFWPFSCLRSFTTLRGGRRKEMNFVRFVRPPKLKRDFYVNFGGLLRVIIDSSPGSISLRKVFFPSPRRPSRRVDLNYFDRSTDEGRKMGRISVLPSALCRRLEKLTQKYLWPIDPSLGAHDTNDGFSYVF